MTDLSLRVSPELYAEHQPRLRAFVRGLVSDPSRADDVVQETWLQALKTPPREAAAVGRWLRTVAKRLAYRTRSREEPWPGTDAVLAEAEREPSAAAVVEREMARRAVVDAVLALPEPYRSAVLLRYFRELSPREIARRLGLPLETVRTRLKRGLARLRGELEPRR